MLAEPHFQADFPVSPHWLFSGAKTGLIVFPASASYDKLRICEAVILKDTALETSRVAKLTAKQRECLHLVLQQKPSKEIARILDISKPAVDQRLANARRILGAATRDEAALIYARAAGLGDPSQHDPSADPTDNDSGEEEPRDEQSRSFTPEEMSSFIDVDTSHEARSRSSIQKEPDPSVGIGPGIVVLIILTLGMSAIVLTAVSIALAFSGLLTT